MLKARTFFTLISIVLISLFGLGHTSSANSVSSTMKCSLVNHIGVPIYPSSILVVNNDIYLLGTNCLWYIANGKVLFNTSQALIGKPIFVRGNQIQGIPVQEFSDFVYYPKHRSIIVLDKCNSLFEFDIAKRLWKLIRTDFSKCGSFDPDYVAIACENNHICLLDPEQNQIWELSEDGRCRSYFRLALPWRLKRGDINVSRGISICADDSLYVLNMRGNISKYKIVNNEKYARQIPFTFSSPFKLRSQRIYTAIDSDLYLVERENNRVIAINKTSGASSQFLFNTHSNLRGLFPEKDSFYIVDGNSIVFWKNNQANSPTQKASQRQVDMRLQGLSLPLAHGSLPAHPGVYPGARRLYRFGVHKGVDFFNDPGCGTLVSMNTNALAADSGKVIRADNNFQEMSLPVYGVVLQECIREHNCSNKNEDLLRGRQVWVDHGHGLITRYAHLNGIRKGLSVGSKVERGELLGYIGISGTSDSIYHKGLHPHLHFEVWLDGKYLGYGLTPSETMFLYEDIFGTICKQRN